MGVWGRRKEIGACWHGMMLRGGMARALNPWACHTAGWLRVRSCEPARPFLPTPPPPLSPLPPCQIESIPAELAGITRMESVSIFKCKLTSIPGAVLSGWRECRRLALYENTIQELPPEIGDMEGLQEL